MAVIKQQTLMNKEYLAEYSLFPKNYNYDELTNFLKLAEILHIVPIVGQELYEELLDQVNKNEVTSTNASLLLKIYPFLGAAVFEVAVPAIAIHVSEIGLTLGKSDNSDSASLEHINYLINYIRSSMISLKEQLINFLNEHSDLYPLIPHKEQCNQIKDNGRVYGFKQINTDVDGNRLSNGSLSGNIMDSIWRFD